MTFLDSHVYLPLASGIRNSRDNAYVFNFGPILIGDANLIQARTPKSLSWKIANRLANQYQVLDMLKSLFYKSQNNLFKAVESVITKILLVIKTKIYGSQRNSLIKLERSFSH